MQATLGQALSSEFPQYEQPPLGQRRCVFLSGMYGSEVVEIIHAWRQEGGRVCPRVGSRHPARAHKNHPSTLDCPDLIRPDPRNHPSRLP
jgi:hypothetical protein